jgi:uncharacterized protein YgbK (DUF1537 family)
MWMEMTRNGYRFNLEGWPLSRVVMVVFGSVSTVTLSSIDFFAQQHATFRVKTRL